MSLEFTGTIKKIKDTQIVSDKFKKREMWVTDDSPSYPQTICFEATQDKVDILDAVKVGEEVTVGFNLKGREWADKEGQVKVFNTLQCWKVVKTGNSKAAPAPAADDNDGLPF